MKSCGFSLIHSSFKRNRLGAAGGKQLQEKFLREEAPALDPGALTKTEELPGQHMELQEQAEAQQNTLHYWFGGLGFG